MEGEKGAALEGGVVKKSVRGGLRCKGGMR